MRLALAALVPLALGGCSCSRLAPLGPKDGATGPSASATTGAAAGVAASSACGQPAAPHGGARPAPVEALPPCPEGEGDWLARAIAHYDAARYPEALSCAAQAAAAEPDDPAAHSERAAALVALGHYEPARVALARALALDPDHVDALMGAADLYLARLPFSREHAELGLVYAERGRAEALKDHDRALAGSFSALAAAALNDLGRAREAAVRADEALGANVEVGFARYEKASALFELCRFEEARRELEKLLGFEERAAHVHYYLGLLAERAGDDAAAERELAEARRLDPETFPPEVKVGREEFAALVARAVAALPQELRRDLAGVPVTTEDLPALEDLLAPDPPLSPAIVGLFRGPPLTEGCTAEDVRCGPCRSIVLYRKNMARAVRDRAELEQQIEVTLLHEVGHLRGEDDTQLVARGLE